MVQCILVAMLPEPESKVRVFWSSDLFPSQPTWEECVASDGLNLSQCKILQLLSRFSEENILFDSFYSANSSANLRL